MRANTLARMTEFDPLDIHQQEAAQQEEAARLQRKQKQDDADFTWLMHDKRGRRIVWNQLAIAGVFRTSFDPNAMTMAFNEGRRSEGLRMLARVHEVCPDFYTTMMKENT